jgi:hypothetical protein
MAHFIGCCCPECVPTAEACSEANSGVTGGICAATNSLVQGWEMEISGLTVNDEYCVNSGTCDDCYKPKGTGLDPGTHTCHKPSVNGWNDCYSQPTDDLNGTYIVAISGGSVCCSDSIIHNFSGADYECPSCAGPVASACPFPTNYLHWMVDFYDHSGDSDYPGPVGTKLMLWNSNFNRDGCEQSHSREARYYFMNDIFRAYLPGSTFNCAARNVFHNEITSPDAITIAAGTFTGDIVVPFYWGGTITLMPIC